jgi:DNA-binding LytR/AlgR family response regulator
MTRVAIIEDEVPARERLIAALRQIDPHIEIVAELGSVAESIQWFESHDSPELVFADVQLSDGLALDIFTQIQPAAPIIFCTAYDEYMVDALAQNGIAYLLKPYGTAQLRDALDKYRRLESHFTNTARTQLAALARSLAQPRGTRRILAREGDAFVAVPLTEVAYFGVREGLTELVHRDGRRLELDRTLSDIEAELAGAGLFRLNRQFLAQPEAVRGFRAYFKGRLLVQLQPPADEDVVVSQPNAARFRSWLEGG